MNKTSLPLLVALLAIAPNCSKPEGDDGTRPPVEAVDRDRAAPAKDDTAEPPVRVPVDGLPAFGSARALVTIVAFTDYECPYCAKADDRLATLRAEYGERIRLVVASMPLVIHEHASPAARAFLAAAEQGKGEAMHLRLFGNRDTSGSTRTLDEDRLRVIAGELRLDVDAFNRARKGPGTEAALRRSTTLAARLGVNGTPTFFVNGRRLVGARPLEAFRALVDEELVKAQRLVDQGTPAEGVYAALLHAAPEPPAPKVEPAVPDLAIDVDVVDAPILGPSHAPITVVLFSDFECPFCVKAENTLRALEAAHPGKVRVAFRHRPLPMHANARLAARASVAAERQGKFWEYHDVLLGHRDALARLDLESYASQLGLDRARFARDFDNPEVEARVAADDRRAEQLGVKGTPTAFVNGRRITGAQPIGTWLAAAERSMTR